jgi:ribonucleoside-diphosphate reductase alpha chain
MLFKDHCNGKSNQQNLGCIKSSNLCTEIVEYTSKEEVAVCNLASISLAKFADYETRNFDYEALHRVTKRVTKNLNKVIDRNFYPIKEAENSNMRHRPIGIGVQGLADAYQKMGIPFETKEALDVNNKIFETIYHAAMETSMEIAMAEGPYSTFKGSPLSEGKFQFDLWNKKPHTNRYDWDKLRADVMKHGARNSLLVAPMPTASTSQILGNNESFEPFTSNIYTRRVLSGEFICVNKHLVRDLIRLNLWTTEIKNQIVANNGSVQDVAKIPANIKELYKTIWEIKQKDLIDLAIGRGPFICQSQSLNLYQANPQHNKMSNMHFYSWSAGLKTGQYYFRSRPARDAIKFTVNVDMLLQAADKGSTNQVLEVLNTDNAE